jgi:aminoglycoside phosphotransferase (APT) family kinase protein
VESRTKRRLDAGELERLVAAAFGSNARLATVRELTDGWFNAAYAIELDDGRKAVVKVAPPPKLRLLTYETDLMRTEIEFLTRAAAAGVPVPRVLYSDLSRTLLESDFLVLDWLEGVPLDTLELDEDERADVRRQVGALAARLHAVGVPMFGYPRPGSATWQPTWRASFLAMVGDVLDDARALASDLTGSPDEIEALVAAHAGVLDDVTEPALVHFDLWDGNVFVRSVGGSWVVEAVIDGERAFYGDPCAELVSAAGVGEVDLAVDFLAGYAAERGELLVVTDRVRRRHVLYSVYLLLIMCTEGATRGFDDEPEHQPILRWAHEQLAARLDELRKYDGDAGRCLRK